MDQDQEHVSVGAISRHDLVGRGLPEPLNSGFNAQMSLEGTTALWTTLACPFHHISNKLNASQCCCDVWMSYFGSVQEGNLLMAVRCRCSMGIIYWVRHPDNLYHLAVVHMLGFLFPFVSLLSSAEGCYLVYKWAGSIKEYLLASLIDNFVAHPNNC